MNNDEILEGLLLPLSARLGGITEVYRTMPTDTLIAAASHADDVIPVSNDLWVVELPDIDRELGYDVYDSEFRLKHSFDRESGLEYDAWGTCDPDVDAAWQMEPGDFIYVVYLNKNGDRHRILMLVKV